MRITLLLLIFFAYPALASEVYWESSGKFYPTRLQYNQLIQIPEKVNLNTADKKALMQLVGVGEKKAQAILHYRKKQGAFHSFQELTKIKGFTQKMVAKIIEKNKQIVTLEAH